MPEEKLSLNLDTDPHIARLIYDVAIWQVRCAPTGATSDQMKIAADDIRDAANLVFLSMDLIREWRENR